MSHLSWQLATLVCLAGVTAVAADRTTVFHEGFDDGNAASRWTLVSFGGDYAADFAFDYSARGIPPAPGGEDTTTIGLRLAVNNNDAIGAPDAVSVFPLDVELTGARTVTFDLWLNYNGGPGGGSGSTEFATFGMFHAGDTACFPGNPASDGFWFAVSGEGGAAEDYRVYSDALPLSTSRGGYAATSQNHRAAFFQALFPTPPFETTGAPGKRWVRVEMSARDGVIEWRLNGMLVALRYEDALDSGALMLGYMDTFASIASPAADNFVIFDNVQVTGMDCDHNGQPDDLDRLSPDRDCNANGVLDDCEIIPPGDFDADGDRDASDFSAFAAVFDGPQPALASGCLSLYLRAFDTNADEQVDLADFAWFQTRETPGPFAARDDQAVSGSQFMAQVTPTTQAAREQRLQTEILSGNVPGFMRTFVPITVSAAIGGETVTATYFVTPDYLSVGHDRDFVRMPMTPSVAQPVADALGCLLPTRKMVDQIYAQAGVKLAPAPISPATVDITRATTLYRHHQMVAAARGNAALGLLIAGHKKDVVITPRLLDNPGRVAIYGWHRLSGVPIQPLYLGHAESYVDYSHGVRLVAGEMIVDGVTHAVADVLSDPNLHVLLSDEGVVENTRYAP